MRHSHPNETRLPAERKPRCLPTAVPGFGRWAAAAGAQQGMALLVVLAVMAVMITAVLEMNRQGRRAVAASAAGSDRLALEQMHQSGIQAAMAILMADKAGSETDTLQEEWADSENVGTRVASMIPFEGGKVAVSIADEMARLQVNALVERPGSPQIRPDLIQVLERLVETLKASDEVYETLEVPAVTNSLTDWLDGGDDDAVTGLSGAESDHYQGMDPAYPCRNGAVPHLSELLRVKGVTAELFHGVDGGSGLNRLLTVDGPMDAAGGGLQFEGRININTADTEIIMALLPAEDQWFLESLDTFRTDKGEEQYVNDISDPAWYKSLSGWEQLGSEKQKQFESLITIESNLFRVTTEASLGSFATRGTGIVERVRDAETNQWRCRLLRWEVSAAERPPSTNIQSP